MIRNKISKQKKTTVQHLLPDGQDARTSRVGSNLFDHFFLPLTRIPNPPKLEILISSTSANDITIRSDGTKQHSRFVSVSDLGDPVQTRIGMYHDRVGRVPVSAKELLFVRGPLDGSYLRRCSERVQSSACRAVPYVDGCIVGTTTTSEKRGLPRAPRNGLKIK
jgi:hypothetical protein